MKKIEKKRKMTGEQKKKWLKWLNAIFYSDREALKKMISDGFNVNYQDKFGWTALMDASAKDDREIAKLLIEKNININMKDAGGATALHIACHYEYIEIAKLLIESGADVNIKDSDGNTPLDCLENSISSKYEELMQWFAEHYPEKMLEYMANENLNTPTPK